MTEQFNNQLLNEFAHAFYGYGNYEGEFWFIGPEQGGESRLTCSQGKI